MCFLNIKSALTKARARNDKIIPLNQDTKLVIFSDLHRGVGDWADDFMHNSLVFTSALDHYFRQDFIYLELGDGDELYENRRVADIVQAHGNVFQYLNEFHKNGRLIYIWGNHNKQFGNTKWLERELQRARTHIPDLFLDLVVYETALLGEKIFLFHGHQGDLMNDLFAFFSRFLVRTFWRPLQTGLGFRDPTSPAKNMRKRNKVENLILEWARENKMVTIAGHTHRPMFASLTKQQRQAGEEPEPYYFNSGSGVHPRCVTCLEIQNMHIELVKWHTIADSNDERRLKVQREVLPGCSESLDNILSQL